MTRRTGELDEPEVRGSTISCYSLNQVADEHVERILSFILKKDRIKTIVTAVLLYKFFHFFTFLSPLYIDVSICQGHAAHFQAARFLSFLSLKSFFNKLKKKP